MHHWEVNPIQYLSALTILEMLCVNLYISHICLERKASAKIVVPVMAGFTLLLVGISSVTLAALPGYGEGFFVFLGFFYLIPLFFLYRCSIKTTLSVMCLSWSYTILIYLFSKYLGQFFPEAAEIIAMLIIQTVMYLLTLRFFLPLLHERLLYVIVHDQPNKGNMFFCLSASTCAVTFCANWVLLKEDSGGKAGPDLHIGGQYHPDVPGSLRPDPCPAARGPNPAGIAHRCADRPEQPQGLF